VIESFRKQELKMAEQKKPSQSEPVPVQPEPVPIPSEPVSLEPASEPVPVSPQEVEPAGDADEPISLVESDDEDGMSKIRARKAGSPLDQAKLEYKRQVNLNGTGATRCRIFHARIAEAPLGHMQNTINEWLDANEIEVKQVGHLIGIMEGKTPEPNLLTVVWY
jgi:hypothetical protein